MKIQTKLVMMVLLLFLAASLCYNVRQRLLVLAGKEKITQLSNAGSNADAAIIARYKRNNTEHAVVEEYKVQDSKPVLFIDSLKDLLAIKEKQLIQATKVNAVLKTGKLMLKEYPDSLYGYEDKWMKLTYAPDSKAIDLSYSLTLSTVRYWKRKWLLAPRQYYIDIFSDDPRVTIESVRRFTIEAPKPKKFGLGLSIGYCYGFTSAQWQPYIGLGLNYNLVRF